jgi:hypothetical protein
MYILMGILTVIIFLTVFDFSSKSSRRQDR